MGTEWPYKAMNERYKSGTELISLLIETRAKGGNLLRYVRCIVSESLNGRIVQVVGSGCNDDRGVQNDIQGYRGPLCERRCRCGGECQRGAGYAGD